MKHDVQLAELVDDSVDKSVHHLISGIIPIDRSDTSGSVLNGVDAPVEIFTVYCEQEIRSERDYGQRVYYKGYPENAYVAETVYADVIKNNIQNAADACRHRHDSCKAGWDYEALI